MRLVLASLILLFAAACSSTTTTPSTTTLTPATFVMTWPTTTFGSTPVGAKAATPVVVTLSNYGTAAVPVSGASSSNAAEFPVTTTCGGSLASNSVCQVTVNFIPSATGARTSTLTLNANSTTQTLSLTGTGVTPVTPRLAVDITTGPPSTIFTLSVTGGTASGTATLNTIFTAKGSPGVLTTTAGWALDSLGSATIARNSDALGTYENWIVDNTTGTSSNHVTYTVK